MTRTVRVIFARTCGRLLPSPTTTLAIAGFLGLSAGFFVHALLRGDGGFTPVAALWAVAAVPFLPVLAALVTMRLLADERASGRLEMMLVAPILERDIVFGKFLGAFFTLALSVGIYLLVPLLILPRCAPALAAELSFGEFLPATVGLLLQGMLWCATGILASAAFRHAASAAFAGLVLVLALPHAVYQAALAWSPALRTRFADLPFATHAIDFATGRVPFSALAFYAVLSSFALFAAVKAIAAMRLRGRGARGLRVSTAFVTFLAFVFSCLAVALAVQCDFSLELPGRASTAKTSARTRQILADAHGDVSAVCFLARKAPEFRAVTRLLRGLETTAQSVAGLHLTVDYIDPRWELGRAQNLAKRGVKEGTIVFQRGGRHIEVPVSGLFPAATNGLATVTSGGLFAGETACASAILNLMLPARREVLYWTVGHGEYDCESYDAITGFSDIARDLCRDGYTLRKLDLAASTAVPEDCAVLVVAGAKTPFSHVEANRVRGWLASGGRLVVLAAASPNAGVGALLSELGAKALPFTVVSPRTLAGADVVVRDFSKTHEVTRPLVGCTVVFASSVPFVASNAETAKGTTYTELVRTDAEAWGESEIATRPWTRDATTEPSGPLALGVALERGGTVAKDVALRPMRVVAFGDAGFVANGALARQANANRDLFLNSLAWLAGLDAVTAPRVPGSTVVTRMERDDWMRFGGWSAIGLPMAVLLLGVFFAFRRGGRI